MSTTPTPAPATPSKPAPAASPSGSGAAPTAPARKPLAWRVPNPKKSVADTPSCNPNYRPPAPGT